MKDTVTQVVARIIGTGAIIASVPRSTDDRVLWVLIGLILFLAWVAEPLDRLVARKNPDGPGAEAVTTGKAARSRTTALLIAEALLAVVILLRVREWL